MTEKASEAFDFSVFDETFSDPKQAAAYLEDCLKDNDIALFQEALKDVARAQKGGMAEVATLSKLGRESLYKALAKSGNPRLETVSSVLNSMGLRISVAPL